MIGFVLLTTLSLASDLDSAIAKIMKARSGAAVVIEVSSGRVLGAYHMEVAARRLARPGSAFKPFTLLALLESGKVKAGDPFSCRRTLRVGKHDLSCTHPDAGVLQAASALAYSCNDYFATNGARLTPEELHSAFVRAGFNSVTGIAEHETAGSMQLARTLEERQLQAVGEGEMRVTPMEMVSAYRKLAEHAAQPSESEGVVIEGLKGSTQYGMARLASVKGLQVAGKTGTSRTDQGHWTNGWFAGFAPADKPEVAVVVFLERGTGPGDAAPLAGEILSAWQKTK